MRFLGANFEMDLMRVQALRSNPPGAVTTQNHRRRVFGAALHQFDGLARAAGGVDPSIAPILLFYALAQANQAIAAAHIAGNHWRPVGHGLAITAPSGTLGEVLITPDENERSSFRLFCRAIGSDPVTGPVALGEVWSAVSMLPRVAGLGAEHREAMKLTARGHDRAYLTGTLADGLDGTDDDARDALVSRLSAAYPTAADGLVVEEFGSVLPHEPHAALVSWRDDAGEPREVEEVAPPLLGTGGGAVLPPALSTGDVISPVAAWWAVLLAVSSVARYRPDLWRASLDRDVTPVAVAVEDGLGATRELLPIIVLWALTGHGWRG